MTTITQKKATKRDDQTEERRFVQKMTDFCPNYLLGAWLSIPIMETLEGNDANICDR